MVLGKVSVVIPMYNAESLIAKTIQSALDQTYADLEVIVIDDGSTDASASVVDTLLDRRITLVQQKNSGVCAARNTGICRATGEWVYLLDADDLLAPNAIEVRLASMADMGFKACYSRVQKVTRDGCMRGVSRSKAPSGSILEDLEREFLFECGSNGMMRRDVLELLKLKSAAANSFYYQPKWFGGCEDWEFALRLAAVTDILFVPEPLVSYTVGHNAGSRSQQRNSMLCGYYRLMRLIREDWFLQDNFPVIPCERV